MAKTKQTLFIIFTSPQSQVAAGTCYIAQDGTTTIMRSEAARFHSFTDAKEFAKENHIGLNGSTYIGLEDFTDGD